MKLLNPKVVIFLIFTFLLEKQLNLTQTRFKRLNLMFKIFKIILASHLIDTVFNVSIYPQKTIGKQEYNVSNKYYQELYMKFKFTIHVRDFPIDFWIFIKLDKLTILLSSIDNNIELTRFDFEDILILYDSEHMVFSYIAVFVLKLNQFEDRNNRISRIIEYKAILSLKGVFVDIINHAHILLLEFLTQPNSNSKLYKAGELDFFLNELGNNYNRPSNNYEVEFDGGCIEPPKIFKVGKTVSTVAIQGIQKDKIMELEKNLSEILPKESILALLYISSSLAKKKLRHDDFISKLTLLDESLPNRSFVEVVKQPANEIFRILTLSIKDIENFESIKENLDSPKGLHGLLKEIKVVLLNLKHIFEDRIYEAIKTNVTVFIDINLWGRINRHIISKAAFYKYFDFNLNEYQKITRFGETFYLKNVIDYKSPPDDLDVFIQKVSNNILEVIILLKEVIQVDYSRK